MTEQTTREHLYDLLGISEEEVSSIEIHERQANTVYGLISYRTTYAEINGGDNSMPVIRLVSWVADYDREHVSVIEDNSMWIPADRELSTNLMQMVARSRDEIAGEIEPETPPREVGCRDVDADLALDRVIDLSETPDSQAVERMVSERGIDPSREWGYGAGPPPEIEHVADRLREADLDPAEHVARLVWGQKEPMDRTPRPVNELVGNYGIELLPRDSGLIAIDVDYPEEYPDMLIPDTLEVSSPHGSDEQRHILLRCEEKERVAEEIGAWAVQGAPWGDLWIGDRYVVGPGSQLGEYGCDNGEHDRGEAGGCEHCEDPDAGYYEIVSDEPIAEVDPDFVIELLEESDGYKLRNDRTDPSPPDSESEGETEVDPREESETDQAVISCDSCDESIRTEEAMKLETAGKVRYICEGGCE